ncbi:MAG TPA: FliA/WhiG family RNA polymerase sigma factor [Nitrospirales bacterium]|nr:FliA/WhiG family RNA polymerase sigma factor [Nitrospirales bacterium]
MDDDAQHFTEPAIGIKELDSSCLGSVSQDKAENGEAQDRLDQEHVTRILLEFLPIIRRMAGVMAFKNPFSLDVEDLTSAGAMGLLSALKRYDPTRDIKFRTFAEYRIRGMMLDEIRAMDWVPRSVRSRRDQVRQIVEEHLQKNGTPPTSQELAALLGVPIDEIEGVGGCDPRLISLDEPVGQGEDECTLRDVLPDVNHLDPFVACADAEMKAALSAALETLSARQQEVLQSYYHTGLTMKEIGHQMGLTESGVCRVHSGALRHLRIELKRIEDGGRSATRPKNLRKTRAGND